MKSYEKLLVNNKSWAAQKLSLDPNFFTELAHEQRPEFLWIGCSDSRVPADLITGTQLGEIFVHRNVANLVLHSDMNLLSVLQYAVEVIKVKHILVVGHYNCGGVKAAMSNQDFGLINNWLRSIKDVYELHHRELDSIADENLRYNRLVELNVLEQVKNLAKTGIVQKSWQDGEYPYLHGWVFDLHSGLINDIIQIESGNVGALNPIFRFDHKENIKFDVEKFM